MNESEEEASSIRYAFVEEEVKTIKTAWVKTEDLKDAGNADLTEDKLEPVVFVVAEETVPEVVPDAVEEAAPIEESAQEPVSVVETAPAEEPAHAEEPAEDIPEFVANGDTLAQYNGNAEEVTIADGIKTIGKKAFYGNQTIRKVILPDSVETIAQSAFENCSNLENVVIGSESKLNKIEWAAFKNDKKLDTSFAANVATVVGNAFDGIEENRPDTLDTVAANETVEDDIIYSPIARFTTYASAPGVELAIIVQPQNTKVKSSTYATFSVEATGDELSYQWQTKVTEEGGWNNTSLSGNKTATLNFKATTTMSGRQFRCVITDAYGNSIASEPAYLYIGTPLNITGQPEDTTAPLGSEVEFEVTAVGSGRTYQWQERAAEGEWTDSVRNGYNSAVLSFTAEDELDGYEFRCIVTDSHGFTQTSETATLTIERTLLEIVAQPESIKIKSSTYATFSVEATGDELSYQWQTKVTEEGGWNNTSLSGNKTATLNFKATTTMSGRQFRCVITDAYGNSIASEPAYLYIGTPLNITGQPEDTTVAVGFEAEFEVAAVGSGRTYQWQERAAEGEWIDSVRNGYDSAVLSFTVEDELDGYEFRCIVTDSHGFAQTSETATLMIERTPLEIVAHPQNIKVKSSTYATFLVEATGDELSYQWQTKVTEEGGWNNTSLSGNKTATLNFKATTTMSGRQFRCVITDAYGNSIASEPAYLYIGTPLNITGQPEDTTVAVGFEAEFEVAAVGSGRTYQWQERAAEGEWIDSVRNGYDSAVLSFTVEDELDGYEFRCIVTDSHGFTQISEAATLMIERTPLEIVSHPQNIKVKSSTYATFSVEATGDGLSYQWQTKVTEEGGWNNTSLSGNKTATLNFKATTTMSGRQFRCVITDAYGNSIASEPAYLYIGTPLNITGQPEDTTVAVGFEVEFEVAAVGSGRTYQWQERTAEGEWTDSVRNGYDSDVLSFTAEYELDGYEFRCIVTDSHGFTQTSETATLMIERTPLAIVAQPESIKIKSSTYATFSVEATGDELSYQWQTKVTEEGGWNNTSLSGNKTATLNFKATTTMSGRQFRCVITDAYGNSIASEPAYLYIGTPLNITGQPEDTTAPLGSEVEFEVTAVGSGRTYQWQERAAEGEWTDSVRNGYNSAVLSFTAEDELDGYEFRCIVTDSHGFTQTSETATLTIERTLLEIVAQPESIKIKSSTYATFSVEATGDELSYQWQTKVTEEGGWNNTSLSGNKTATLNFKATTTMSGRQFRCVITDAYGNSIASEPAYLYIGTPLNITGQPEDTTAPLGSEVEFEVTAVGSGRTYQWQERAAEGEWTDSVRNGYNSAVLSFTAEDELDGYEFRCIVTDSHGFTQTSETATLTIEFELISGDFTYRLTDELDGVCIVKYNGNDSSVCVPAMIDGKPVVIIGTKAFENNESIASVSLPNSVAVIESRAFAGCIHLNTMTTHD